MKQDALKKLISENRDSFDDRMPGKHVWSRIENTLFGGHRSLWNSVPAWRAAAILLAGLCIFLFVSRKTENTISMSRNVSQEFLDIESYYATQISEKVALISNEAPFADDSFTQDINKLEAMYSVLVDEMKKHPSEKVKDALVLNMLVRVDLLNQQIQKLEESKKKKPATPTA